MARLFLFFIVLALPAAAIAQGTAIISGRVLQVADGAPIAFASVIVEITSSGQSLSSPLTSEDGRF